MKKKVFYITFFMLQIAYIQSAHSSIIWDNGLDGDSTNRGAGHFMATTFISDNNFTLNQIDQRIDTLGNANVRFAIFNADTANLLFYSDSIFHTDNGMDYVSSPFFNFDILAGTVYSIAAVTDTRAKYSFKFTDVLMNGISNPYGNQNGFSGSTFVNPLLDTEQNCCNNSIRLHTDLAAVPAPAAVWLFGFGLIGLIGMRKKSTKYA